RELEEHYLVLLNDEVTAWALLQKDRFSSLAEGAGVRVPKTLGSPDEIDAKLDALREPILVKPRDKTSWQAIQRDLFEGSSKARVFPTQQALRRHPAFQRYKDQIIVQEYIASDTAGLCSFHGFADQSGRILAAFAGRKIRTFPKFAGESCFVELIN